jgi:hypothetical protein
VSLHTRDAATSGDTGRRALNKQLSQALRPGEVSSVQEKALSTPVRNIERGRPQSRESELGRSSRNGPGGRSIDRSIG